MLTLLVAFSVYWMLRRLSGSFWIACLLAALCCYSFLFLMMPRPVFFSIALLCVTLTLLLEAERTADVRKLYWLPVIFLLWANLHIQFIYGLGVWGLFVAVHLMQSLAKRLRITPAYLAEATLPAGPLTALFGASLIATLIGPYSYHLYGVIFAYSRSQLIYSMITELQPLSFRAFENVVELLLAGAAFFAIARQKRVDLFKLALMAIACVVAFRTMRDSWFLCITAAACIADSSRGTREREREDTPLQLAGVLRRGRSRPGHPCAGPGIQYPRPGSRDHRPLSSECGEFRSPEPYSRPAVQQLRLGRISDVVSARRIRSPSTGAPICTVTSSTRHCSRR